MGTLFGQDEDDEDAKFKSMLGDLIGSGPAPYETDGPQSLQLTPPTQPGASSSLGGYTPPPAAQAPQYMDHVEGHQFGGGDIAMLAGILGSALFGGRFKGAIATSLAGQYGGAVMQDQARRNAKNDEIDLYNNKLANQDTELSRWKADTAARAQYGNLQAREAELALQRQREQRIADGQAAEDAIDPVQRAKDIAEARAKVDLDTTRQKNDMEVGTREMLGEILGKQRAQFASPTGKGATGSSGMNDPAKELKAKLAQAQLDGIDAGTVDPLTGKPKDKPQTPAQVAAEGKAKLLSTPFPGSKVDNPEAFAAATSTAGERSKLEKYFRGVQQVRNSLQALQDIRASAGTVIGASRDKSDYDAALTAAIGGFTDIGNSGVLNGGEFARYKDFVPGIGPHLNDIQRFKPFGDGKDPTLEQLKGVSDAVERLASDGLAGVGISFDGPAKGRNRGQAKTPAPTEQPMGSPTASGISFSVDPEAKKSFDSGGGTRTVTVTNTSGVQKPFTGTEEEIEELRRDPRVRSVE